MSIVRAPRPESHFVTLRNDVVRDQRLSYRARGLLAAILSRPDDWRTTSENLAAEAPNGEGREAVRTALRELKDAKYMHQRKVQNAAGRWVTESVVFDTPTEDGFPGVGLPDVGFLGPLRSTETKNPLSDQPEPVTPPGTSTESERRPKGATIRAAFRRITDHRVAVSTVVPDNPAAYRQTIKRGVQEDYAEDANALMDSYPDWDAEELAEALDPAVGQPAPVPPPDPKDQRPYVPDPDETARQWAEAEAHAAEDNPEESDRLRAEARARLRRKTKV